jgi:hypothetical protein
MLEYLFLKKQYIREILEKSRMKNYNLVSTSNEFGLKLNKDHERKKIDDTLYKQTIGSLIYLTAIR